MKRAACPARILLVDDHRLGTAARQSILIDHGYEVETASCGDEAWEKFCASHFDIVVTEAALTGMTGVDLIRRIREANSPARVVLLAKFLTTSTMTRKNTLADELIAKSAKDMDDLLRAVEKLAARPRRREPASQKIAAEAPRKAHAV